MLLKRQLVHAMRHLPITVGIEEADHAGMTPTHAVGSLKSRTHHTGTGTYVCAVDQHHSINQRQILLSESKHNIILWMCGMSSCRMY